MIGVSLIVADAPADRGAVQAGHREVEQHQVGRVLAEPPQRLLAVVGGDDAVAGLAEQRAERADHRGLVVDDEDLERARVRRCRPGRVSALADRRSSRRAIASAGLAPGALRSGCRQRSRRSSSANSTRTVLSPASVPSCSWKLDSSMAWAMALGRARTPR